MLIRLIKKVKDVLSATDIKDDCTEKKQKEFLQYLMQKYLRG